MRLDRLLANSGCGTRNEIRVLIKKGKVTVNGQTVTDPSVHVSESDDISIAGETTRLASKLYYMFDKPDNVLTAMEDKRLPTVSDFIPANLKNLKLSPVGRLDYHSTGLLIITNDGEMSHRLLSPRHHVDKIYYARVTGEVTQDDIQAFESGIVLPDGLECLPAVLKVLGQSEYCDTEVTIREGKFHQIKRMFLALGHEVVYLKRLSMGPLTLDPDLAPGEYRRLTSEEVSLLKSV